MGEGRSGRHRYVVSAYIATLPYATLSCPILFTHVRFFKVPLKITVQVLVAGCQLSYCKFYDFLYSVLCDMKIQLTQTALNSRGQGHLVTLSNGHLH